MQREVAAGEVLFTGERPRRPPVPARERCGRDLDRRARRRPRAHRHDGRGIAVRRSRAARRTPALGDRAGGRRYGGLRVHARSAGRDRARRSGDRDPADDEPARSCCRSVCARPTKYCASSRIRAASVPTPETRTAPLSRAVGCQARQSSGIGPASPGAPCGPRSPSLWPRPAARDTPDCGRHPPGNAESKPADQMPAGRHPKSHPTSAGRSPFPTQRYPRSRRPTGRPRIPVFSPTPARHAA